MTSATMDPESEAILGIIERQDNISVYNLAKKLGSNYGKIERQVTELIKIGKVFAHSRVEKGRNIKMLSLNPVPVEREIKQTTGKVAQQGLLSEAFHHLHGIFLELNELGIDPTPALFSYAEKHGIEREDLVAMLDAVEESITS